MNALALSLLAVLATSVSKEGQPPAPCVQQVTDEAQKGRPPPNRSGDMPGYGGRPIPPQALDNVPLAFTPTEYVGPYVGRAWKVLANRRVSVQLLGDDRPPTVRSIIGYSLWDRLPVSTHDEVGAWCSLQLVSFLRRADVDVMPSGGDLVVSGKVRQFFVQEGGEYDGTVTLVLTVSAAGGGELWSGTVQGTSQRWGRAYKADLYLQSLSDALLRAFDGWINDPGFIAAVGGKVPPPPVRPAAPSKPPLPSAAEISPPEGMVAAHVAGGRRSTGLMAWTNELSNDGKKTARRFLTQWEWPVSPAGATDFGVYWLVPARNLAGGKLTLRFIDLDSIHLGESGLSDSRVGPSVCDVTWAVADSAQVWIQARSCKAYRTMGEALQNAK